MFIVVWFELFSFLDNESLQLSDQISASCVCRIISCIIHSKKLTKVHFNFGPSFCAGREAWRRECLPVPPREVWVGGWTATLSFIRVRRRSSRLQLPSPSLQTHLAMFRDSMPPVLTAASALVVFDRFSVSVHVAQQHLLQGTMLSQRWRARASVKDKVYLGKERLQLLCCGCPLSALLLRLATVVDHSGRTSIEHMHVVCIMKHYLNGVARRLWSTCIRVRRACNALYDSCARVSRLTITRRRSLL